MTAPCFISEFSDTFYKTGESAVLYHGEFPVIFRKGISTAEMRECTVDQKIAAAIDGGNVPVTAFCIDSDPSHAGIDLQFSIEGKERTNIELFAKILQKIKSMLWIFN